MIARRVEIAIWIGAIALATLAGARGHAVASALSQSAPRTARYEAWGVVSSPLNMAPGTLTAASDTLVARNPFRLDRKPSDVVYDPAMGVVPPAPPTVTRPPLAVVGIVGGPPWEALVEGIPGRQGSVLVRRGDTLGGLRVRSITRDIVRISGMDTVWTLPVRRAW